MAKKHWIVMGGLRGYMPSHCEPYHSKEQAVQSVVDMYDLGERQERELRQRLFLDLSLAENGNEYVELVPCLCDTPQDHTEDGVWEEEEEYA